MRLSTRFKFTIFDEKNFFVQFINGKFYISCEKDINYFPDNITKESMPHMEKITKEPFDKVVDSIKVFMQNRRRGITIFPTNITNKNVFLSLMTSYLNYA